MTTMRAAAFKKQRHKGQAMTEYLIILPSLLLLILGVIQLAFIYQAKSTLNYATFLGARQGSLKNANLTSIKDGVAGGMTPFFMHTSTAPDVPDLVKARLISAIEIFNPRTASVEILSPSFDAFNGLNLGGSIPNDNLMYRTASADGMSIQDANLLKIRVTYCVKLIVPFVDRIIYGLATGIQSVSNLTNESFWQSNAETRPNLCSAINAAYGNGETLVQSMNAPEASGLTGPEKTALAGALSSAIPGLGWNLGGWRIPITSEAIVRMQSPVILTP